MNRRVVILQETFPRYRVELFAEICRLASARDMSVQLVHGMAPGKRGERTSGGSLPHATLVRNRYLGIPGSRTPAVWQPALRACLGADLVVVEQANRLLINYILLLAQRLRGPKVAFWGHGRNLQSSPTTVAERFKSRLVTMPTWWFAYTPAIAADLTARGVPSSRITAVGNTIDVVSLRRAVERYRAENKAPPPGAKCVFLGGLYSFKRLEFLFRAADLVAKRVPTFELHIAGNGEERDKVERFVERRPWARYWGPVEGEAHARLLASARLLLIPGLVGLVVLDSFAAGVPLVTTADALHSPEIDYLRDGVNGVMVSAGSGPEEYADVVVRLLQDVERYQLLSLGAKASARLHTVDSAAERFVDGLSGAFSVPGQSAR